MNSQLDLLSNRKINLLMRYNWGFLFYIYYKLMALYWLMEGRHSPVVNDSFNYIWRINMVKEGVFIYDPSMSYVYLLAAVAKLFSLSAFTVFNLFYVVGILMSVIIMSFFLSRALRLNRQQINLVLFSLAFYSSMGTHSFLHFVPSTYMVVLVFLLYTLVLKLSGAKYYHLLSFFIFLLAVFISFIHSSGLYVVLVSLPLLLIIANLDGVPLKRSWRICVPLFVAILCASFVHVILKNTFYQPDCVYYRGEAISLSTSPDVLDPGGSDDTNEALPGVQKHILARDGGRLVKGFNGKVVENYALVQGETNTTQLKCVPEALISNDNDFHHESYGDRLYSSFFSYFIPNKYLGCYALFFISFLIVNSCREQAFWRRNKIILTMLLYWFTVYLVSLYIHPRGHRILEFVFPQLFIVLGLMVYDLFLVRRRFTVMKIFVAVALFMPLLSMNYCFAKTENYMMKSLRNLDESLLDQLGTKLIVVDGNFEKYFLRSHRPFAVVGKGRVRLDMLNRDDFYYVILDGKNKPDYSFIYCLYRQIFPDRRGEIQSGEKWAADKVDYVRVNRQDNLIGVYRGIITK